jgi:hypothetical protein
MLSPSKQIPESRKSWLDHFFPCGPEDQILEMILLQYHEKQTSSTDGVAAFTDWL